MSNIIQGLWIGETLSELEKLSIASYIKNDHEYHLYTYNAVDNLPKGVIIKDGNEVLDKSKIFSYTSGEGKGSFSAFSNFFRYKLLLEKGGWWSDTDMICLKHYDFDDEHVFASEPYHDEEHITSGLIKAPQGSSAMKYAWQTCQEKDPNKLVWGEVGPRLVSQTVEHFGLNSSVKPHKYFCPLGFEEWVQVLNPNIDLDFVDTSYAVHLWNEMWRRSSVNKNQKFNSNCLYEKLKERYLNDD